MTKFRPVSRDPVSRYEFRRFRVRWALFASVVGAILVALMALGALA